MRLLPMLLLRLALLVAMAASAVLIVDYANAGDPAFCGVKSGCFAVRTSGHAYLFGYIPLPTLGLVSFASLFGFVLVARSRIQHAVVAALSSLGALFALYLLWLQHSVIGAMCPWCVAVDSSALVTAISSIWVWRNSAIDESFARFPKALYVPVAWLAAGLVGIVSPFVWGQFPKDPSLPEVLQSEQVPDKLTLVSFTDFECPFCRRLSPAMHEVLKEHEGRIHFVRKMMPLSGHPGAEPAALAYLCTPESLQEQMADKLYAAPTSKLTPDGTLALALGLGVDPVKYTTCLVDPATRAKLDADKKLFEELGGRGLPFTFVGKRVVLGAQADGLKLAVARELGGKRIELPIWAMFALIGVAFAAAIGLTVKAETNGAT
jgi:uncharacterized membrane protein/thiol-disulfide isomerase/thioredoxin